MCTLLSLGRLLVSTPLSGVALFRALVRPIANRYPCKAMREFLYEGIPYIYIYIYIYICIGNRYIIFMRESLTKGNSFIRGNPSYLGIPR